MRIVNLIQGSPEWLAHRAEHFNASDAPAMMGVSSYKTRTQLMTEIKTGVSPEIDAATQRIFDDGHRFEALARPLAEKIIGQDLYPVVGAEGKMSASFDGITLDESIAFEHKTLNAKLRESFDDINTVAPDWRETAGDKLPIEYRVQMEHQAMVSQCKKILFMASRWNGQELVEMRHVWYIPNPELRKQIQNGWAQLILDLQDFTPEIKQAAPVGRAPDQLPALTVSIRGEVAASNLAEFKAVALGAIEAVNTDLQTDQDFADAEKAVKWCEEVESRLKAAKEHAQGQAASIDELFRTMDAIAAEARAKRLELDKLVKSRKEQIRNDIVWGAQTDLRDHVAKLNARIGRQLVAMPSADFGGVIKGKRSLDSIKASVDEELARVKLAANDVADRIEINLKKLTVENEFLFPDLASVVTKEADDFTNLLAMRVNAHRDAEEIRRESAQADAIAAAQVAAQVVQKASRPAIKVEPVTSERLVKLGEIQSLLAPIQITADGLAQLGFPHVDKDGASKLYRADSFDDICQALIQHLQTVSSTQHA